MRCVEDLIDQLRDRYDGAIPFKQICIDEGIIATKAPLEDGVRGFYVRANSRKVILVNSRLKYAERRDWAFHELWHHFRSTGEGHSRHHDKREERRADLFAALCRIPAVRDGDGIDEVIERYGCSRELARIRIEYEGRKTL